ncbi:MAG TPA: GNAT family N-acetyltransferase [Candidatus Cybelea sp.]
MRPAVANVEILPFDQARDSFEELTRLLYAAYRRLGEMGLNFVATTQDIQTTRRRIAAATACWVARKDGRLAGTLCYYGGSPSKQHPAWYEPFDVGYFAQFAVEPSLQGSGIGTLLLAAAQTRAIAEGKTEFACDTAEPARHLIAYYARNGFRIVGRHQWPHAVYASVIVSKRLGITIRRGVEADRTAILEIAHAMPWDKDAYLDRQLSAGGVEVACDGDAVAGFIVWNHEFFARPFVWLCAVEPRFRRSGIGSLLFAHVERQNRGARLYSSANRSREGMHRFFERRGYRCAGEVDLDPGDPEVFYFIDL